MGRGHSPRPIGSAVLNKILHGGGAQSATLVFDYSAYLSDPDVLALGHDPWWVEIVFTTNNDSNHNDFLWEKARLVPEPISLVLLGLGIVMLGVRRRR